ncbi:MULTISPECIES: CsbD family protein [unclassified Streptomyces]|uniref:CsbD family protein n=1 Tax=unclassified Streptomyces TaxID=2593676 RepID=UPI003627A7E3
MSNAMDKAKGRLKEVTGKITGNERLETEGRTDQAKTRIRETMKSVRERAEGIKDSLKRDHS